LKKAKKGEGPLGIIQLCTRYPPGTGGVETHVHAISTELKARGHDVEVFTSDMLTEMPFKRISQDHERYGSVDGVPVHRFKATSLSGDAQYSFMPAMWKAVMASKADIVHAHSYGFFQTHLALAAKKMRRTKFVFTPHFHPEWASGKSKKRRFLRRAYDKIIGGKTLSSADVIICVSRGEAMVLKELDIDSEKVRIVPNGIPEELLGLEADPSTFMAAFDIKHPFVLFAGRLAENKGLEYLAEAAAHVAKERPDVKFVIVGEDGGARDGFEKRVKALGIQDNVKLTGHIQEEAVFRSAFAACDIFVLPSIFEAFGIVILEAMAMGRPCVATRVGGVPDLVSDGRTGILVEPKDPVALAKGLIKVLDEPALAKDMGVNARKRVGKEFTWPRITDRLEHIYKEVLR